MWNGLRCQEALEGGVFTKKTFIDVGSPDEPVPYSSSNLPDRDAFKARCCGGPAPPRAGASC